MDPPLNGRPTTADTNSVMERYTPAAAPTGHGNREARKAALPPLGTLKVWSWWQRDELSHAELACVIAARGRSDVDIARRRLGLVGRPTLAMEGPADPGFATAMRRPFRLMWMTLDDYVDRSTHWMQEEQLHALRTRFS